MRENLSIPDLDLQENIREIRERVGLAAEKSGRLEKDIAITSRHDNTFFAILFIFSSFLDVMNDSGPKPFG